MTNFLITGGTGKLGLAMIRRIHASEEEKSQPVHTIRTLSRHPMHRRHPGAFNFIGSVVSGEGVERAMEGVDVIVHLASGGTRPGAAKAEVAGVKTMLQAAASANARFVYVSIVGVDNHRLPYYKAKRAAESLVEDFKGDWIIQRSTQFHQFLAELMGRKVMPVSDPLRLQPIDAVEVADRLIAAVADGETGRLDDMGGPEVLRFDEICTVWRDETDDPSPRLISLPSVGPIADFAAGIQLCPDHPVGQIKWRKWLQRENRIRTGRTRDEIMNSARARRDLARDEARDREMLERMRASAMEREKSAAASD